MPINGTLGPLPEEQQVLSHIHSVQKQLISNRGGKMNRYKWNWYSAVLLVWAFLVLIWLATYPHGRGQHDDDPSDPRNRFKRRKEQDPNFEGNLDPSDQEFIQNFDFDTGRYLSEKPGEGMLGRLGNILKKPFSWLK